MPAKHITIFYQERGKQRGVVLMIMLVIMVMGAAAFLVSSLNSSSALKTARLETSSSALAQAKEALIGRAVTDATNPGSLPCPDTDDDGSAELFSGTNCPSYIGRLPWRTLRLPDLRDGSGERLWYALSPNFRDYASAASINSDSQGTLNISGTTTASNVIAIVFAPGSAVSGQSRSATQTFACTTTATTVAENLCATNYLEGSNPNLSTAATPNTAYQTAASTTFDDQIIFITHDRLFSAVEKRIARETKKCLDDYAATNANKYPWAAPVTDSTYTGTYSIYFGRIPATPNIDTSSGSLTTDTTMLSSWSASCTTLFSSPYWTNDWRNEVFYQVANGYQPGSSASFGAPLSINGSGAYRATVLVARQAIGGQVRSTTDSATYLESLNKHQTTLTATFETYNSSDSNYSTVNDLVLCLDGKVNCL